MVAAATCGKEPDQLLEVDRPSVVERLPGARDPLVAKRHPLVRARPSDVKGFPGSAGPLLAKCLLHHQTHHSEAKCLFALRYPMEAKRLPGRHVQSHWDCWPCCHKRLPWRPVPNC